MTTDEFHRVYVDYVVRSTKKQEKRYLLISLLLPIFVVIFLKDLPIVTLSVFILLPSLSMGRTYQKFISDNLSVVLTLSGNLKNIIRKLTKLTAKRTTVLFSTSALILIISYWIKYGINGITLLDLLFIMLIFILALVLNSIQWLLSMKYKRSIIQIIEFLFIATICIFSALMSLFEKTIVLLGIATLCVLLICSIRVLSKHIKVSKEKIILGV
jgi:hypothetical protein